MPADRDPNHLCEALRVIYQEWLDRCFDAGLNAKAIVTWRSALDQDMAKSDGLSNAAAGQSPHNCCDANGNPSSKAFDFAIFEGDGVYITDGTDARYRQAAQIGKGLGLVWGGDWLHPDWDHLEMANWQTS
jgi:peptidoglycan LD-endopeptidase CwlK